VRAPGLFLVGVALIRDVLDDVDTKDADVAADEMDDEDDCEPRLLRLSSLLLSTRSCSVFLLSAAVLVGVLLLLDDVLATLLAMLLMLLLLLVLRSPLLPSAVELWLLSRALMDAA
jgi:uncharacterized membrane protein